MTLWHAFVVFCIVFCGSVGVALQLHNLCESNENRTQCGSS